MDGISLAQPQPALCDRKTSLNCAERRRHELRDHNPERWHSRKSSDVHRHGEITAEFLGEIDRYAGVNAALTVEQLGVVSMRHDRAMPDARMDVGPGLAVAPEAIECLGRDIVA